MLTQFTQERRNKMLCQPLPLASPPDARIIWPSLCLVQPLRLVPESSGKDPDGVDSPAPQLEKMFQALLCTCLAFSLGVSHSLTTRKPGRLAGARMSHVKAGDGSHTTLLWTCRNLEKERRQRHKAQCSGLPGVFMSWAEAVLAVFKAFESSRKILYHDTKIVIRRQYSVLLLPCSILDSTVTAF